MNLIANTEFTFMLVFPFLIIILRTDMRVGLILTGALQCGRSGHLPRGCLFVSQEIFVRIPISTDRFEEIQEFFDRLMLNGPGFAKYENSSLARTKKFMDEDDIIAECVLEVLNDHFESKIFSFADSLLDFDFDGEDF
jgi:hypothetical protein